MNTISFDDFKKLDIRIGTIAAVETPEGSEKLYRLMVDLGTEFGMRTIFAGLKKKYQVDQLVGKQVVILVNLAPKRFFNEQGQGMLLAVDCGGNPVLLKPQRKIPNGSAVC